MNVNFLTKSVYYSNCKKFNKISSYIILENRCLLDTIRACRTISTTYIQNSNRHLLSNNQTGISNGVPVTVLKRWYSDDIAPSNKLPPLMDFPKLVWPSFLKTLRNFILVTFIIKPYLDNEFTLPKFVSGSKKAVEVVSNKISSGDTKSLSGLITSDIIPPIDKAVALMSVSQRELIAVNAGDIYFAFPYQIGIIFNDEDITPPENRRRTVEITMVYHILKGLTEMRNRGEEPPINIGVMPEYQSKLSVCNYRFVREYQKGVDSDWTINLLNHFRPIDEKKAIRS